MLIKDLIKELEKLDENKNICVWDDNKSNITDFIIIEAIQKNDNVEFDYFIM